MKNRNKVLLEKFSINTQLDFTKSNGQDTLLLLNQPSEDNSILQQIGLDTHLNKVKKEFHIINSKEQFTKLFNRSSFLGSEIKLLANKYDLTIGKASKYLGVIPSDLSQIINNFIEEHSEEIITQDKYKPKKVYITNDDGSYQYDDDNNRKFEYQDELVEKGGVTKTKSKVKTSYSNWFILAPRESFSKESLNTCCTLFYRDSDSNSISENDVFVEVYSWGKAYSDLRTCNNFLYPINYTKEFELRNLSTQEVIGNPFYILLVLFLLISLIHLSSLIILPLILQLLFLIVIIKSMFKSDNYKLLWKI